MSRRWLSIWGGQCMCMDGDWQQFFFLYSESIAERRPKKTTRQEGNPPKTLHWTVSLSSGDYARDPLHVGRSRRRSWKLSTAAGTVYGTWPVVSLFRSLWRNDRLTVPSTAIRLIVTPARCHSTSFSIVAFPSSSTWKKFTLTVSQS